MLSDIFERHVSIGNIMNDFNKMFTLTQANFGGRREGEGMLEGKIDAGVRNKLVLGLSLLAFFENILDKGVEANVVQSGF